MKLATWGRHMRCGCFRLCQNEWDSLVALAGVVGLLVAQRPRPAGLALAGEAGAARGVAGAMEARRLLARLAAGQNAVLQLELRQVLQLAVDVQVADAAVEAGAVLLGPLLQRCHICRHWHPCRSQFPGPVSLCRREPP